MLVKALSRRRHRLAKQPMQPIDSPAQRSSRIDLTSKPLGQGLRFISFVPTAWRPEEQVKFQCNFSVSELRALGAPFEQALAAAVTTSQA
jgi:hypothetical protein